MKRFDYFWPQILVKISGITFLSQMIVYLSGSRTSEFEWVIYVCGAVFFLSVLYALVAVVLNSIKKGND